MTPTQHLALLSVVRDVIAERHRQHAKWGEQDRPIGNGGADAFHDALEAKDECDAAMADGSATYRHIIREEYCEAMAEDDPACLREELVQLAAVVVQAIEALDRRLAWERGAA